MGRVVSFIIFYLVAIPLIGIGSALGIYGAVLNYLDAQERFSVLGLPSIYWAFGLVLVGSVTGITKLVIENRSLRKNPISPEMRDHHQAIITFLKGLKHVDLLTHDSNEIANWVSQATRSWPIPGGDGCIDENGQVSTQISMEGSPQWRLAYEHLPKDRLWKLVEQWKSAVAKELKLRRQLWQEIYNGMANRVNVPLAHSGDECVSLYLPFDIYDRVFRPIAGLDIGRTPSTPIIEEHRVWTVGFEIARSDDQRVLQEAAYLYQHGEDEFKDLPVVAELTEAYKQALEATLTLHDYVDDLTQSTTLPKNSRCHRCPS